jgi:hypothetical protein
MSSLDAPQDFPPVIAWSSVRFKQSWCHQYWSFDNDISTNLWLNFTINMTGLPKYLK